MDPFTATVLGFVAIAAGVFTLANSPYIIASISRKHDKAKRQAQEELEKTPEYQSELIKKRNLINSIDKQKKLSFVGVKNSENVYEMKLREEFQFDIERDVVLKGKLRCFDANNQVVEKTIYLYQPRLFASSLTGNGEVCIGPKLKNGLLNKHYMYLAKKPNDSSEIYYGYVPKAEISSGSEYDFDKDNPYNANYRIFKYINITFDYDENGNVIPVNLKDKKQRDEVLAYIEKYKNSNEFYEYARIASRKLEDELEQERIQRMREDAEYKREQRMQQSASNTTKHEEKVDKEQEEYKKYYDYMYGHYGTKSFYNKFDDVRKANGDTPLGPPPGGPHGHHGPRR